MSRASNTGPSEQARWYSQPLAVRMGVTQARQTPIPQHMCSSRDNSAGRLNSPASRATAEPWPEADGLVSDGGGQSLWVCGADCTPVLLADPATGRVGACHAGWRGVAGRIVPAAITLMEAEGSRREDLLVALGPAVSGPNYQVDRSVSCQVASALLPDGNPGSEEQGGLLAELSACGALIEDPEPERDRLDIRTATRRQLEREGIAPERISVCPLCTVAEPLLFHSWRRDSVKAVQWSGIVAQA